LQTCPHHVRRAAPGRECPNRAQSGTNDLVVSDVLRPGELQSWFLSEHLVDAPLVEAEPLQESA
jgi:hypothetical protein